MGGKRFADANDRINSDTINIKKVILAIVVLVLIIHLLQNLNLLLCLLELVK